MFFFGVGGAEGRWTAKTHVNYCGVGGGRAIYTGDSNTRLNNILSWEAEDTCVCGDVKSFGG